MTQPTPGSDAWLHQVREEPIDPDRPIIDPHHHLWHSRGDWGPYLLGQLWADTGAGHNIRKTGSNAARSPPASLATSTSNALS